MSRWHRSNLHWGCSILLVLLLSSSLSSVSSTAHVNWYMNGGDIPANVAFVQNYSSALTGLYLCCNSYSFLANGSFIGKDDETIRNETIPLLNIQPNLQLYYVIGISNETFMDESWRIGIPTAVATLERLTNMVTGFIVDYEPANNYTLQHSQAYANFLKAFADAIHSNGKGQQLGFDVAGWGILNKFNIYNETNVDIYTSMTPTYYGTNLTENENFVEEELESLPVANIGIGIGSMLKTPPEWNYNYTATTLNQFIQYLQSVNISRIDIWRADIDHYGITEDYYFTALENFLHGGTRSSNFT